MLSDHLQTWNTKLRVMSTLVGSELNPNAKVATFAWTREGISERLGIHHSVVSRHLRSLEDDAQIEYRLMHISNLRRRRKVPHLTSKGAKRLREEHAIILKCEVLAEFDSGRIERRPLGNLEHLLTDLTLLDPLSLVEWLERVGEPIPLAQNSVLLDANRADDRMLHWILSSANDRSDAVDRAIILLTKPLAISSLMRWQLELLASEANQDGWKPEPQKGANEQIEKFLLNGNWSECPKNRSNLLDACSALLAGKPISVGQEELIRGAVNRGAPTIWLTLLESPLRA